MCLTAFRLCMNHAKREFGGKISDERPFFGNNAFEEKYGYQFHVPGNDKFVSSENLCWTNLSHGIDQ